LFRKRRCGNAAFGIGFEIYLSNAFVIQTVLVRKERLISNIKTIGIFIFI
jgi:hypothetical protein